MPQCQFLFSAIFVFQKVTQEIFLELDEMKPEVPIFPDTRRSPKQRWRRARRQPHHLVARPPSGHARVWCGPLVHPLTSPFRLYILSEVKTLNESVSVHEKFYNVPPSKMKFGGQKSMFWHPARMGNCPRSHLHRIHLHLHRYCYLP
jgi:hypothetical protein